MNTMVLQQYLRNAIYHILPSLSLCLLSVYLISTIYVTVLRRASTIVITDSSLYISHILIVRVYQLLHIPSHLKQCCCIHPQRQHSFFFPLLLPLLHNLRVAQELIIIKGNSSTFWNAICIQKKHRLLPKEWGLHTMWGK